LGVGINPGMALAPLSSSIGQGLNPRHNNCQPSAPPLDLSFCCHYFIDYIWVSVNNLFLISHFVVFLQCPSQFKKLKIPILENTLI